MIWLDQAAESHWAINRAARLGELYRPGCAASTASGGAMIFASIPNPNAQRIASPRSSKQIVTSAPPSAKRITRCDPCHVRDMTAAAIAGPNRIVTSMQIASPEIQPTARSSRKRLGTRSFENVPIRREGPIFASSANSASRAARDHSR